MSRFFYKSPSGDKFEFYSEEDRKKWGAPDLVRMTDAEVQAHLNPPPPAPTREQIEALRLRAYADPLTGSDRYFAEAARLQAMGAAQEEIDAANAAGANRYAEIQNAYPWPA